jgi:hypothetical protein
VGYGDYLEQLTFLLFLKMADEFSKPPYNRKLPIPKSITGKACRPKRGADLEIHYTTLLRELSQAKGILGQIFIKSQNKIQDPAKLYKLIDMIDKEQWSTMGADVKGQNLRRLAGEERRRHQKRRRTVFHPQGADTRHGGMCKARANENHSRPSLRHWRFLFGSL